MINLVNQEEHFKNHVAKFTDYGNIKILDFQEPGRIDYRIRFLFEEDFCRLHISGDLGELIACNFENMTYEGMKDFVNNPYYFEEKIRCHNRRLYTYDEEKAKEELKKEFEEEGSFVDDNYCDTWEEAVECKIREILWDFDGNKGGTLMKITNGDKLIHHFENVVDVKLFTVPEIVQIIETFSLEIPEGTKMILPRGEAKDVVYTNLERLMTFKTTKKSRVIAEETIGAHRMNRKDRRWEARVWLSRAWEKDDELRAYERRKEEIISQLSGIGKYDAEFIPSQTGENSVETKNIEYSQLCAKIEQVIRDISHMNARSLEVISQVENVKTRSMLYDRFINRMTWNQIGNKYHYAKAQPYRYVGEGLDEARRHITEEEIREVCYV